jgi:DMSO/TMAO reductase YedYZ molybdopterin-dependent catalytic subunit
MVWRLIWKFIVRVLELAREMSLLRMGTVGLDGTKIHANASRHSALSYEHAARQAGTPSIQINAALCETAARGKFEPGQKTEPSWPRASTASGSRG